MKLLRRFVNVLLDLAAPSGVTTLVPITSVGRVWSTCMPLSAQPSVSTIEPVRGQAMSSGKIINLSEAKEISHTAQAKENPLSGAPFYNSWSFYDHSSGNFKVGVWDSTAGSWEYEGHPRTEFCYIVEGRLKMVEKDGPTHVFNAGDSFVLPKGTPVTWIVEDYAKKIYVTADHLDGE